ncbi:uncharacterized protein O3C94_002217 [Discoglossus pictus]
MTSDPLSSSEKQEVTCTSQRPLLEISSSTPSAGSPLGRIHNVHPTVCSPLKQRFGCPGSAGVSSPSLSSETESSNLECLILQETQKADHGASIDPAIEKLPDPQELFAESAASQTDIDRWIGCGQKGDDVPLYCCDTDRSEEEAEMTYTSQRPLLEISSSTCSSDGSPLQCAQSLYMSGGSPSEHDCMIVAGGSSPSLFSEDENSVYESPNLERTIESEESITSSERAPEPHLHPQVHVDGSRFIYEYPPPSSEMVESVRSLRS